MVRKWFALGASLVVVACSSRSQDVSPDAPIAECEAFLSTYGACLSALGDTARQRATRTIALTHDELYAEASKSVDARERARQRCITERARLKTSCGR